MSATEVSGMHSTGSLSLTRMPYDRPRGPKITCQIDINYFSHLISLTASRTALLILDHCDAQLALEHGAKLGPTWHCANKTEISPGEECSTFLNTCHTLLDLTGPLQLGALPGAEPLPVKPLDGCMRNLEIDHKFVDLNGSKIII